MYISMFWVSDILGREVCFSRDEEIEIPNVAKSRVARSCPTPDPKSCACYRHGVHEYSCSPKTIRWHNMWLFANLNEQNRVSKKQLITWIWKRQKTGWHPQNDRKNHIPSEPLNFGQTPPEHGQPNAMTRTCDSTNSISQMRFAAQLALYQRPCIATNVPDHLPIQLLPRANPRPSFRTNQLHHYETKMLTKHACFLAMFLFTNDTLSIELNVEIPENPNNSDCWKQNANAETASA